MNIRRLTLDTAAGERILRVVEVFMAWGKYKLLSHS